MPFSALPAAQGLYDPQSERDACGLAMVADLRGRPSHGTVEQALTALHNLRHRGAAGAEPSSGDGSGLLMQLPDAFYRAVAGIELPPAGEYATGIVFVPTDEGAAERVAEITAELAAEECLSVLAWREVPTDPTGLGPTARSVMPRFRQVFVAPTTPLTGPLDIERRAFCLRKRLERRTAAEGCAVYLTSLSSRTVVYKGMLTTDQLGTFFPDLRDERTATGMAMVHSRFSTNTFPSWPLAHPFRYIAHNGEINTIKGNRNWMRAREALLETEVFGVARGADGQQSGGDLSRLLPILTEGASDSASFDEVLELLHLAGRSLPHAVLMMIPEAWENNTEMDACRRGFYEFHASLMEPWDGPAGVAFTDGTLVGAVLDRNGLRPARWWRTADDRVILASEAGVLDVDPAEVVAKGRLQPGRMFLVDTAAGRIVEDDEIKDQLAASEPYRHWVAAGMVTLAELPPRDYPHPKHEDTLRRQQIFGYTEEELRVLLEPMAATAAEATGSMGTDTPVAVLSRRSRLLYDYFSQLFAQVTNPPLDAIREELVTSLASTIGPDANLLAEVPEAANKIVLPFPVLANDELAKVAAGTPSLPAVTVGGLYEVDGGGAALAEAITRVRSEVVAAIEGGARIVLLTDRGSDATHAPIPSLLLTAAVHHHLVRERLRTKVGLVVETGDCREVHHAALLIGYGAGAINPYLAMETVEELFTAGRLPKVADQAEAARNLVRALGKGVLKVMSKMGISTVASYTGAQVFEALGLSQQVVDDYFTGTASRLGGVGLDVLAEEVAARHRLAYPRNPAERAHRGLETGGEYQWRREGEVHLFNPETVFLLQHATRSRQYEVFRRYTEQVDALSKEAATLRGLFRLRRDARPPVPIDEVEPVSSIVRRFSTGAMSYGSISIEAHETLAVAMNTLGGRSNSGEGGEDAERLRDPLRRSAVKQVASGRFGVTSEYLVSADDIQIKMAQGAKPGEGGQLPGSKVYPWIAKTRHSTPGVGLISPPPHHDIYSIEDLAQLIHDLKNANPAARVHVKLVAEVGVGTVAAGVSKAHADVVLISGHDGGTGAAPLTSIKHAGAPWEVGLAETQQTLLRNGLRDRIVVQADGQLKTGRDVIIAALLGAEEFGFASAPLVVSGCVMMRVCHLDTCPVGVATQNPQLRQRFTGKPEFVVNFFEFIAEEVREYLAALGCRTLEEAIGRAELLDTAQAVTHWKAAGLDLTPVLHVPDLPPAAARSCRTRQDHGLDQALDNTLIQLAEGALADGSPVTLDLPVRNVNRTVGTMLGYEVTKRWGGAGLPEDTISVRFTGSAGQSFGAFLPKGVTLRLSGDANDYLGKGLSGGRIIVAPDPAAPFAAEEQIIAGNVIGYGATGGQMFLRGIVGERFCVRNSGAVAIAEGTGDHGCEYMTGGTVVVLGRIGRNFAAGMSGGTAYLLDPDERRVNLQMADLEEVDARDGELLRGLVERHHAETGSPVAARLLTDWDAALPRFRKVMPHDYKRVQEAARRAEREGLDINEAVMAAAHG